MADDGYTDTHRAFLQALLSRQTIDYETAKPLIASIQTAATPDRPTLPGDITFETFEDFINTVSDAVIPFDYEILGAKDQHHGGEGIWALVNTTSDAMTQMATVHGADEIAFVKRVLDCMFEEKNDSEAAEVMAVKGTEALNLRKAERGRGRGRRGSGPTQQPDGSTNGNAADITMHQADLMLQSMVAEGWFELSENGYYSLSQRGVLELKDWLVKTYDDADDEEEEEEEEEEGGGGDPAHKKIKSCSACRQIITVGQRCPDLACHGRLHDHCTQLMWRQQRDRRECPVCKLPWENAPPVGEKAARDARRARGQNGRRSTNGRKSHAETNGAHSDGSEDLYNA
ncbi:related to DNA repair Nse1 [Lecanosticta acicola]|uniref:Non-structural maintenance of chromosomes element 1 homolog n=1 Tax=Lecanosticta acicola TaxID=111012 RepID=A0AAI8YSP8_9PEZI|nr:related to DNA repair Nse1 [Lecanosticta acicola]